MELPGYNKTIYTCHMLDVTRLRVLVAVARHGSVTAAARALNYAQPSVSHHIARLEAETGARLLQRAGRGVRLTEAGRLLAERAEEIIGRLDAAENELAAHVGLREGRVRLAAFPSALGTIVPAAAAWLEAESPGIDLMLAEAEPPEALRMLRAGYVDVALVFRHYQQDADPGPPGAEDEGARGRLLLDEPVHLVTQAEPGAQAETGAPVEAGARAEPGVRAEEGARAEAHRSAEAGARAEAGRNAEAGARAGRGARVGSSAHPDTMTDLTGLAAYSERRWIAGCERCRSYLLRQCALAGFTPKIAFTTDDYVAVQALVAAGLGVTTLPGLCLRAARHPGVQTAPLPGARRHVFAMTYGEPPDPPTTARLIDVLARAAAPASAMPESAASLA
jgi:DNA-binding transcriptional LysR family regulator